MNYKFKGKILKIVDFIKYLVSYLFFLLNHGVVGLPPKFNKTLIDDHLVFLIKYLNLYFQINGKKTI